MIFQPVIQALVQTIGVIVNFIPHLINGLIILIIGYIISALVRWLLRFIFRQVRLEQVLQRTGVENVLHELGVRISIVELIVQIVFFFLILSFAASAVQLMGLGAVALLLNNVLGFVPEAISAGLIIIFGSMIARFLGRAITSLADRVNITYSNALGRIVEYTIVAFVIVLAISTLGVNTTILTTCLTIIVASFGLAMAITFALGARESARHVIAGYYVRQNFVPGQQVQLGDQRGTVRGISGTYTVLDAIGAEGVRRTISLPNAMLLQNVIISEENSGSPTQAQEGNPGGPSEPASGDEQSSTSAADENAPQQDE
jgi:hypothetical protein